MHTPIQAIRTASRPIGLWSFWDMLNHWGYSFFVVGSAIAYAELRLENYRQQKMGISSGRDITIDPDGSVVKFVHDKCNEILKFADDKELGTVPANCRRLIAKFYAAKANQLKFLMF
jgi:hypothetical protein